MSSLVNCRPYQELYADPTKHFTDEELKQRDANIKPGEEVGSIGHAVDPQPTGLLSLIRSTHSTHVIIYTHTHVRT